MRQSTHAAARTAAVVAVLLSATACSAGSTGAAPSTSPASTSTATTAAPTTATPTTATPTTATPTTATATPTSEAPTSSPTTSPTTSPTSAPDGLLRPGDAGPAVLALQQRLSALGYWLGTPDGSFGALTTQAVYALQGAAGLGRDGVVGPGTRAALAAGTLPRVRSSGRAVEIDLERGLLVLVRDGRPWRVLHTSTGTFAPYTYDGEQYLADTPRGSWSVAWRVDGVRVGNLGRLYRPIYFHPDGIAVHGYPSVPAYPASHGCARVSDLAIDMIWSEDLMPTGLRVQVY